MKIKDILTLFIEEIQELEQKVEDGKSSRQTIANLQSSYSRLQDEHEYLRIQLHKKIYQIQEQENIIKIQGVEVQSLKDKNTKLYNELITLKAKVESSQKNRESTT